MYSSGKQILKLKNVLFKNIFIVFFGGGNISTNQPKDKQLNQKAVPTHKNNESKNHDNKNRKIIF
ncbi:hypothetical protein DC850_22610, partial [Vibrio parahaemolyticus]|nr:hypothetical protein [Vibrio parahaemolyticus]